MAEHCMSPECLYHTMGHTVQFCGRTDLLRYPEPTKVLTVKGSDNATIAEALRTLADGLDSGKYSFQPGVTCAGFMDVGTVYETRVL